jgi:hypothetical protein
VSYTDKKFLFITHLTPKLKRSAIRDQLLVLMEKSLYAQSYSNWKALWLGESEEVSDRITTIDISTPGSLEKVYLRPEIKDLIDWADYILKLDDDDLIMPHALENAATLDFDCYCDRFHTFYDLTTGQSTQQLRPWIAATCVHKKEHAITKKSGEGIAENFIDSLFYGEHGADWIAYYKDRDIKYARPSHPLYVRVLSPTSKSSGALVFPANSILDMNLQAYDKYLLRFGSWNSYRFRNFDIYKSELKWIWTNFSQQGLRLKPKTSSIHRLKEYLLRLKHSF